LAISKKFTLAPSSPRRLTAKHKYKSNIEFKNIIRLEIALTLGFYQLTAVFPTVMPFHDNLTR